jgi:hypothetical protein
VRCGVCAALIPTYLMLRPYRWPGMNVACAANTAPVLGLLGLMIAELQQPMGVSVDSAIAVLLAAQSALAAATVALNFMLLLLSMRMDPARCLGEVLWTAPQWSPRCICSFLWEAKDGVQRQCLWTHRSMLPLSCSCLPKTKMFLRLQRTLVPY